MHALSVSLLRRNFLLQETVAQETNFLKLRFGKCAAVGKGGLNTAALALFGQSVPEAQKEKADCRPLRRLPEASCLFFVSRSSPSDSRPAPIALVHVVPGGPALTKTTTERSDQDRSDADLFRTATPLPHEPEDSLTCWARPCACSSAERRECKSRAPTSSPPKQNPACRMSHAATAAVGEV